MRSEAVKLAAKGLRFGMLLQLAVGPVCLLVLNTSAGHGFFGTLPLVLAVVLADALYVALSGFGVSAVLQRPRVKAAVKGIGCAVLLLFGADMLAGALGFSLLPGVKLFSPKAGGGVFWQGLALTLSNPLTILFWGGMLTAKAAEYRWAGNQLLFFSVGCVLATALFLALVALLGSLLGAFLPGIAVKMLNAAVGAMLVFFGVRLVMKKANPISKSV